MTRTIALFAVCVVGSLQATYAGSAGDEALALARKAFSSGDKAKAVVEAERAVKLFKTELGEVNLKGAEALSSLGIFRNFVGETSEARVAFSASKEQFEKLGRPEHPSSLNARLMLGILAGHKNEFSVAAGHYRELIELLTRKGMTETVEFVRASKLLAGSLRAVGQYEESFKCYLHLLDAQKALAGEESTEVAEVLDQMCAVAIDFGDYASAKKYALEAATLEHKISGEDSLRSAEIYLTSGVLASRIENYDLAIQLLEKAVATFDRDKSGDHRRIAAKARIHLGQVHRLRGDFAKAKEFFLKAAAIYESVGDNDQNTTAEALYGVAETSFLLEDIPAAVAACDKARRMTRNYVVRILPYLSEQDQLGFIEDEDTYRLHEVLSACRLVKDMPNVAETSAAWIINSQGVVNEALTRQNRWFSQMKRPEDQAAFKQLVAIREQLASLSTTGTTSTTSELAKSEKALNEELKKLTNRLLSSGFEIASDDAWIDLEDVRSCMDADEVFVQFARFQEFRFFEEESWGEDLYAAWVIPKQGPVRFVDLGAAKAVDDLIEQVRRAIAEAGKPDGTLRKQGDEVATRELLKKLTALRAKVWDPLQIELGSVKHLCLSPDGPLWLAPWGALPLGSGEKFLIEEASLQMVVGVGPFLEAVQGDTDVSAPVIFANPKFDLSPDNVWKSIVEVLRNAAPSQAERQRSVKRTTKLPFRDVLPLPNTAVEADLIAPSIKQLGGGEPIKHIEQFALESVAKKVRRPSVLVFGTHGFFFDPSANSRASKKDTSSPTANPLAQCGLLLAGCKDPNAGQATAGDDGVLTGLEIAGMDLQNTRMVILSACETGIGTTRAGEGVASLSQAFQLAGAEAVVATLWSVPDRDSMLLVTRFATELSSGKSKAAALQAAQVERIQNRRKRFGAAHPYYWAAFTVNGR